MQKMGSPAIDIGRIHARLPVILSNAAERFIMPRFTLLNDDDISEKAPDEFVTPADLECEAWVKQALRELLPDASVVGEEECTERPELLERVADGAVWLVDPLDGTRNFMVGSPHFAVMVALVLDGVTEGAWIYHPATRRMHHALLGSGAYIDGIRVKAQLSGDPHLVGALPVRYASEEASAIVEDVAASIGRTLPGLMCAGADYPRCVDGTQDFALFWRSLPWDHAAGALFLTEAGGRAAWPDGEPYRVGSTRPGLIAAASSEVWSRVTQLAYGDA